MWMSTVHISFEFGVDLFQSELFVLHHCHFVPRLAALIEVDSILFDCEHAGKEAEQFLVGFSLLGSSCDGDSDVLVVDLHDFALLAVGFGRDDHSVALCTGHDTLGDVLLWNLLFLGRLLLLPLHYQQLQPDIPDIAPTFHSIIHYLQKRMKKIPLKVHPLQERIEAFQKSPLWEVRLHQEDSKLRKIGRNRLKDVSLPIIAPLKLQVKDCAIQAEVKGKENEMRLPGTKNMSFVKSRPLLIDQPVHRMAITQKLLYDPNQPDIKENSSKKQFLIRDKKLVPQRNCVSADPKKLLPLKESLPLKVNQFRRNLIRKSRQAKPEQLPLHVQASRLAHQARAASAPHTGTKAQMQLQDFLNAWEAR